MKKLRNREVMYFVQGHRLSKGQSSNLSHVCVNQRPVFTLHCLPLPRESSHLMYGGFNTKVNLEVGKNAERTDRFCQSTLLAHCPGIQARETDGWVYYTNYLNAESK